MNRRRFLQTSVAIAASAAVAGCPLQDGNRDSATIDDYADADASAAVVRRAPEPQAPYEDSVGEVSPQESDALAIEGLVYQRAGERGLVVSGDATNTGDRQFAVVEVRVLLYERDDSTGAVDESTGEEVTHGSLDPGETWQWAAIFGSEPEFEVELFSVEAAANFA
jgi:hypothetical protein